MTQLNGFIKIHRKLIQWGWYQDNVVKGVFIHLLLTANFKDMKWMGTVIKKGQLVTSYSKLAADLGFSAMQIRTAISKLASTGEITSKSTNKYTVITVVNWGEYQIEDEKVTSKITSNVTNKQQADSVNKVLTRLKTLKNSTSKITSKKSEEKLIESAIIELEKISLTSNITNEQQTNNKQITNDQQQRKNIKNGKKSLYLKGTETEEEKIFASAPLGGEPRKEEKLDPVRIAELRR